MREAKTFSRAILAGPAEALPSADPVLIALAEYERQRAATDIALKAYEIAAEAGDFKEAEQRFGEASVAELGHCPDNQPSLIAAIRAAAEAIERRMRAGAPGRRCCLRAGGAVMTSKGTTTVDDAPSAGELAFDHLIKMRMRLRGFAALMESAFENTLHFEHEQMQGVVQLAADLSERMDECYEAAVPIVISVDEARPAIIAIIEREAGR